MKTISIDIATCIKCGHCVRVCPSEIISQRIPSEPARVDSVEGCISCGHCVAVCPSDSVLHSEFPAEKVHPINYSLYPTPEQMMHIIKGRRSNRAFSSRPIPKELLLQIAEAAHRAPTASNTQTVSFTIITDPEKLKLITDYTIGIFDKLGRILTNPLVRFFLKPFMKDVYKYEKAFSKMKEENEKGNDQILRKATALLLIHTPKKSRFGSIDANLAYENASLMAESLGIAHFYTGFVLTAINQDGAKKLSQKLGIDGVIHAGMAMAMASFKYPNYIDRKELSDHLTMM
ncbi:nitroreductase family protein [Porphyromonadaceae bacterium]